MTTAEKITRNRCLISNLKDVEEAFRIKRFPAFIGTTNEPRSQDIENDLIFDISKSSGMIQIRDLMPMEIIYSKYHCEAIGPMWKNHHNQFVNFLNNFPVCNIIEPGGSNNYMAKAFLELNKKSFWTIIEPTPNNISDNPRLNIIKGFFNKNFIKGAQYDAVVHSHTFEHMHNPEDFIKTISDSLSIGCYHIFTVPNLRKYFENRYSNVLNFEHTFYLSEEFVEYYLTKYGFEIIEKKYFLEHSIFYSAVKRTLPVLDLECNNFYDDNKRLLENYNQYFDKLVQALNEKLDKKKYYLFGAHVFSQFLIKKGLKDEKIINILDNSKIKNNQRLYGTELICSLPGIVGNDECPIVVVFAGGYQEEIERQLVEINSNVIIINDNNIR